MGSSSQDGGSRQPGVQDLVCHVLLQPSPILQVAARSQPIVSATSTLVTVIKSAGTLPRAGWG